MAIEQDLNYLIGLKDRDEIERSYTAYIVLSRFDQVAERIEHGQDLETYSVADFIPPSLRKIVSDYIASSDKASATAQIAMASTQPARGPSGGAAASSIPSWG